MHRSARRHFSPILALLMAFGLSPAFAPAARAGESPSSPAAATAAAKTPAVEDLSAQKVVEEDAAWQKRREAAFKSSPMSPFSVKAAFYIEDLKTERVGADNAEVTLNPARPMEYMAALTYKEERFWLEPVTYVKGPALHEPDDEGDPRPEGEILTGMVELTGEKIGGLGKYFFDVSPQSGMGRVMFYDPDAPARKAFEGFMWFPPDAKYKVKARWVANGEPDEVTVGTNRGLSKTFYRSGWMKFTIDGTEQSLVMLSEKPVPEKGDHFFVPFRDATSGQETYDVGRYLQGINFQGAGEEHELDFNRATNPFCNYSEDYNCPLPPEENNLTAAIRAGEKTYPHHP